MEYQWKPKMCLKCKVFGHAEASCPHSRPLAEKSQGPQRVASLPLSSENRSKNGVVAAPTHNGTLNGVVGSDGQSDQVVDSNSNTVLSGRVSDDQVDKRSFDVPKHTASNSVQLTPAPSIGGVGTSNTFASLDLEDDVLLAELVNTASLDNSQCPMKIKRKNVEQLPDKKVPTKKKVNRKGRGKGKASTQVLISPGSHD